MLAYVYGVVPISLCRSGGCGVSAGSGKGVRIEFDDENDNTASGAAATGERRRRSTVRSASEPPVNRASSSSRDATSVAETRLNNPSIGDGASVGGLTGLSVSGSHMERCGVSSAQRDNMSDGASTTALAGTSITGSLSGSCCNRWETSVSSRRCDDGRQQSSFLTANRLQSFLMETGISLVPPLVLWFPGWTSRRTCRRSAAA